MLSLAPLLLYGLPDMQGEHARKRRLTMKKVLRYILPVTGLLSVLIFCVSATAGIADTPSIVAESFSEPINMLLIGIGLIGFGSFIKRKSVR